MSSESEPKGDVTAAAPRGTFRMGRVLVLVAPIAAVLIGGAVFIGFFDGLQRIETWSRPAFVPAQGQVFYNGEPLTSGQVFTVSRGLPGAMGDLDAQGRFKLQTDVDGKFLVGAFAGEHVVAVVNYERQPGASPPILKTPIIYSTANTSPLKITISPAADKPNDFTIRIEGEPPPKTPSPPIPPSIPNTDAKDEAKAATKDKSKAAPQADAPSPANESNPPTNGAPSDADRS